MAAEGRELAEHGGEVGADLRRTEERRGTRDGEFGSKVISDFSLENKIFFIDDLKLDN